jgi:hypothetical protein
MYSVIAFIDGLSWNTAFQNNDEGKVIRIEMEDLVDVHVEHGEESIWIAFLAIGLYGGPNERL